MRGDNLGSMDITLTGTVSGVSNIGWDDGFILTTKSTSMYVRWIDITPEAAAKVRMIIAIQESDSDSDLLK